MTSNSPQVIADTLTPRQRDAIEHIAQTTNPGQWCADTPVIQRVLNHLADKGLVFVAYDSTRRAWVEKLSHLGWHVAAYVLNAPRKRQRKKGLRCPNCTMALAKRPKDAQGVHYCPTCEGVFFIVVTTKPKN